MTQAPPAEDRPYEAWESTLDVISTSHGPIFIIGGVDVGKTTFTRLLANRAVAQGRKVAVLDADPGQSEIGLPGCAGLAFVESETVSLSALAPTALAFIGSVSPSGHIPEHITAVRRLADLANGIFLIVDTAGYLQGVGARRLVQSEFELLSPAHVVALQHGHELHSFLAPIRKRSGCMVHALPVPAAIARKSPAFRAQRRAMRFAAYFERAQIANYAVDTCAFIGTWLGSGSPLPAHILRFINITLGSTANVFYGETSGKHLGLMANRPISPQSAEMGIILGQLKAKEFTATVTPRLKHLLIGLEAANGKLLGLGLLASVDFKRRTLGILTPIRSPEAAQILRFGIQRVAPDGSDAGSIRPGEA